MMWNRCRVIRKLSFGTPYTTPIKSLKYTSTWARDLAYAFRYRDSQLRLSACVDDTSSGVVYGDIVSARFSRGCGGVVLLWGRVLMVQSLTVSVVA